MVWRNQEGWQWEQEYNLLYVALTRSKSELYVVGKANWLQTEAKREAEAEAEPEPEPEPEPETKEETVKPLQQFNNTVNPLQQPNSKEKLKNWIEGLHEKVRATLLSPEWQSKSDQAIADFCGVSAPTVSKHRKHLQEEGLLPEIQDRVGKSCHKLNTENIGTKTNHKEKILKIASELDQSEILEIIQALETLLW